MTRFVLTKKEIRVAIFILACLVLGSAAKVYRNGHHARPDLKKTPVTSSGHNHP